MKHAIIGTALILYGLFLTPALIEPTDFIVSPALLVAAASIGIPGFIITVWIISGYLAVIFGSGLLGHSIFRRLPVIKGTKNPVALVILAAFIISVVCLWFYYIA